MHDEQILASVNKAAYYSPIFGDIQIDDSAFEQLSLKISEQVYKEPVNAFINDYEQIEPGKTGHILDEQTFKKEFQAYFYEGKPVQMTIPTIPIHPKVDSELLANIMVKKMSDYITYFNKNNYERSHNITLAAEAINNTVVFPNETFSFNETVGERTLEKGYLPAPVIVKGELFDGIGGGICQVSSTLFNAVDRAGVEMVQRYSHSRRVPYVPPGRDATVSWYGPDFTFKNIHNQPILIRAKVAAGRVFIQVFSSDVVNFEPRFVPGAPSKLPEEVRIDVLGD
ncbi:VanW family protein [Bacillus alkalicola]|uniref:VanW family protein n=2 Tax=Bacillales TaxID=1385 RepID=A0ABS6JYC1_9BACI|nr:VanW family protein [Bacillus alkalicola]